MIQKHPKPGYTSYIKIGGVPILPPLVTNEKRIELQADKRKAVDVERRLQCQRDLKLFIQKLPDSPEIVTTNNNLKSVTRTLENLLSFDSGNSHIDALNITDKSNKCDDSKLPCGDDKTSVPLRKQNQKHSKLTCNIFDVTQYSDDGVVIFNSKSGQLGDASELSASAVELDLTSLTNLCSSEEIAVKCNNSKKRLNKTSDLEESFEELKPRLLRSNSYTLEAPSPILIEHFKKQAELLPNGADVFEKYLGKRRLSLDLGSPSTSNDSAYQTCMSSKNTEQRASVSDLSCLSAANEAAKNQHIHDDISRGCDIPVDIVETLARLHFGAKKSEGLLQEAQKRELVEVVRNPEEIACSKIEETRAALHEVLWDMPESCAKDIMDLVERHRLDQELQMESYAKFKQKLLESSENLNGLTAPACNDVSEESHVSCDQIEKDHNESKSSSTLHMTSSPMDTSNALNTSSSLLIDFESDSELPYYSECKSSSHGFSSDLDILTDASGPRRLSTSFQESRSRNVSRQLFVARPDKEQLLKEQWAATVLTAAAKGYLVRRLKRTERARHLMQTIRDAVVCAVGLHSEDTASIQSSDVELHRRLIQQISAACYEFYDMFFGLTIKEQMDLIALDRQKLLEKQKRPKSSASLKLETTKSTPRIQKQPFSARSRKPLTPSFAA